jgi:hypothetical protein
MFDHRAMTPIGSEILEQLRRSMAMAPRDAGAPLTNEQGVQIVGELLELRRTIRGRPGQG